MTEQNRQPEGIPTGGQYKATTHAEGTITLGSPAAPRPELAGYAIPAPLEGQKFLDGTPITGATFEEAYEEFFRPLDEHEAAHGPWVNTRPPSEEKLRDLAGLTGVNLGRTTGFFVEADEATGEPVIAVSTRNGNSESRDCIADSDFDCMTCKHCIQEHIIPALPTYIREEDDSEGDAYVTNYFEPLDKAAAHRYLTDQKTREILNHRTWAREAVTSGKVPPWAILTQARDGEERQQLGINLSYARSMAARKNGDERYARELLDLVEAGAPLRKDTRYSGALIDTAGYEVYGEAVKKHTAEAARLREAGDILAEERKLPLPPAISAIAAAEADRLAKAIVQEDVKIEDSQTRLEKSKRSIQRWADHLLQEDAKLKAGVQAAEAHLAAFDWSSSWPGDPADCPPRPVQQ